MLLVNTVCFPNFDFGLSENLQLEWLIEVQKVPHCGAIQIQYISEYKHKDALPAILVKSRSSDIGY